METKQELIDRIYKGIKEINDDPVIFRWKYKMDEIELWLTCYLKNDVLDPVLKKQGIVGLTNGSKLINVVATQQNANRRCKGQATIATVGA